MADNIEKTPRGLDAWWHQAVGHARRHVPRRHLYQRQAGAIDRLKPQFANLSDEQLKQQLAHLSEPFRRGRDTPRDRMAAIAALREAITRITGLQLFMVQIVGGLTLYAGHLVEMATGEGKSITACVPAILHGWRRRGCHIVTVNDYLARRDAEAFGPVYAFAGLTVGFINQEMPAQQRGAAYMNDITYATNKELCADYLRDQLSGGHTPISSSSGADQDGPAPLLRALYAAIVDEADSVLIDEAVTPLIISGDAANAEQTHAYAESIPMANLMQAGRDYRVDARFRSAELTDNGRKMVATARMGRAGVWNSQRRAEELVRHALAARHFYRRDKQYVLQDGKVVIVDEATGRLMPDRHWRDGLHQAVEAHEAVEVQPLKETLARMSFQRFFRLYPHLAGMSGTLAEARGELWHIYRRDLVRLPTHSPCIRRSFGVRIYSSDEKKWAMILEEIIVAHRAGQPVLVGTRNVQASEQLSQRLEHAGLPHLVLNARHHANEAQIIAAAGNAGRITVATNMAGRGTDIRLDDAARHAGGLYVIATELHESGRVDRQLAGRAGRQGDPGKHIIFASLTDELFTTHAGVLDKVLRRCAGNRSLPAVAAAPLIAYAQHRAEKLARGQRFSVALMDEQLDESLAFAGA